MAETMKMDIGINIDDNYTQHAMAMLCSLCENNKSHTITLHILQKNLSNQSKLRIKELMMRYDNEVFFYEVDESLLKGVQFRKKNPLSMAAYYRLLLAEILPQAIERLLYLDVDLLILKDISWIFSLEIEEYALAATLDMFPYSNQHRMQLHMQADQKTFCSGVMLVNLRYWRDNNVTKGLLEYAKRHREVVFLHDQDVLNYYFKGKWFLLPPKWNRNAFFNRALRCQGYRAFDYKEYTLDPVILHYAAAGMKPWNNTFIPLKKYYKMYLNLSGYEDIVYSDVSFSKKISSLKISIKCWLGLLLAKYLHRY